MGKSSLVLRFTKNEFLERHQATIGAAFATKEMTISDASSAGRRASAPATQVIRLQIWDTAGEEKYRAMTRFYYRNCAAGLIVYDITNKRSFDKLDEWTREFRDHCPQAVILIAGNKSDRTEGRQVLRRDAENYAESRGLVHMEVRVCCVCVCVCACRVCVVCVEGREWRGRARDRRVLVVVSTTC